MLTVAGMLALVNPLVAGAKPAVLIGAAACGSRMLDAADGNSSMTTWDGARGSESADADSPGPAADRTRRRDSTAAGSRASRANAAGSCLRYSSSCARCGCCNASWMTSCTQAGPSGGEERRTHRKGCRWLLAAAAGFCITRPVFAERTKQFCLQHCSSEQHAALQHNQTPLSGPTCPYGGYVLLQCAP